MAGLVGLSQIYIENAELERRAEQIARRISERFAAAMPTARTTFLSEDYLVVAITGLATPVTGDELVAERSEEIAVSSAANVSRSAVRSATRS